MPVLSDQPHYAFLNAKVSSYFFLGLLLAIFLIIFLIRRKSPQQTMPYTTLPEKVSLSGTSSSSSSAQLAKPRIPSPVPAGPPSLPHATSPEMNSSSIFDPSFSQGPSVEMPPRRRSYTKNMPDGGEVSGEIIVAEGWRRHTRVFGGGVCKACEESERRMSA